MKELNTHDLHRIWGLAHGSLVTRTRNSIKIYPGGMKVHLSLIRSPSPGSKSVWEATIVANTAGQICKYRTIKFFNQLLLWTIVSDHPITKLKNLISFRKVRTNVLVKGIYEPTTNTNMVIRDPLMLKTLESLPYRLTPTGDRVAWYDSQVIFKKERWFTTAENHPADDKYLLQIRSPLGFRWI